MINDEDEGEGEGEGVRDHEHEQGDGQQQQRDEAAVPALDGGEETGEGKEHHEGRFNSTGIFMSEDRSNEMYMTFPHLRVHVPMLMPSSGFAGNHSLWVCG